MTFLEQMVKWLQANWATLMANVIALAALLVLWQQTRVARLQTQLMRDQFVLVNRGFLDVEPEIALGRDDLSRLIHIDAATSTIRGEAEFQAVNPVLRLRNVGNLPLRYEVEQFDILIDQRVSSAPLSETDRTTGVLYPNVDREFFHRSCYLDRDGHSTRPFSEIKNLVVTYRFKITYSTLNAPASSSVVDRECDWKFFDNQARVTWVTINDSIL